MLKAIAAGAGGAASGITIGTSVITSGTNTRVLFDDSGVIGESAGFTYVKATGTVTVTAGVIGAGSAITSSGPGGVLTTLAFTAPGTGVATALGVNVGSAGAFVTFNGAGGTPSSLVGTNITGTAAGLTAANVTTNANLTGPITSSGNATSIAAQVGTGTTFVMSVAPTITGNTTVSSGSFGLSGNISAAAWTTAGIRYANVAATLTDTTSSGTVANAYTDLWGGNTIAASSATVFTNYYTATFKNPTAGTNVTMTNKAAILADSINIGGAAQSTFALNVTGTSLFSSTVNIGNTDTGVSRISAGVVGVGTGAAGSTAGTLQATNINVPATTGNVNWGAKEYIYARAADTSLTFGANSADIMQMWGSSASPGATGLQFATTSSVMWGSLNSASDTGLSRVSAGVIGVGTGAAGSVAGTISAAIYLTGTADASASSGSGALQVTGGASVAKRFWIPAITASAGLQTAVLCQSSGGEMIADSVACLASSARFKTLLGNAEGGALGKIIRVPIHRWKYNREDASVFPDSYYAEHIGPTAEEIEAIDSRLVGRDQEGRARSISTDQLLALAIQAIQEQQGQIERLEQKLSA